ncbi:MAG: hypothetical protein L0L33_03445, partial [Tetragenococcus halophilus]|nr:hypothetical protein [Tetragenococcus halophilus]
YAVRNHSSYNECANYLAKLRSNANKPASTKIQVEKSTRSIAQRYGGSGGSNFSKRIGSSSNRVIDDDDDINMLSNAKNPIAYANGKKTLVKGKPLPAVVGERSAYSSDSEGGYESDVDIEFEGRLLVFLNNPSAADLADVASCNDKIAELMISNRPYKTLEQAQDVRSEAIKPGSRKKPEGDKVVYEISNTLRGYEAVDSLIQKCEKVGQRVKKGIEKWGVSILGEEAELSLTDIGNEEGGNDNEDNGTFFKKKPNYGPEI